jgi:hypothetical protein
MEVDEFTGRMTTDENRAPLADLALSPLLHHKPRLLIQAIGRGPTVDITVGLATTDYALFQ